MGKPDPRNAPDLDAACANGDGTYNGARMLSWLSAVLDDAGKGVSEAEVRAMWAKTKHKGTR